MTLAQFTADEIAVRHCFRSLADVRTRPRDEASDVSDWRELSLGMSGDFEIAIEE